MQAKTIKHLATISVFLALFVVMLGAYTRLTDAGLGCPDWPGCYGRMVMPLQTDKLSQVNNQYDNAPIEGRKAWTEMAHRYAAGTLALLIFVMGLSVFYQRYQGLLLPWHLPLLLMLLVLFQALLGMWTVTLKLLPVVVMAHLLGGMLIFASLSRFRIQLSASATQDLSPWRFWMRLAVGIVFFQIALGGWVSANYAGIACVGFPRCNGLWWPGMHLSQDFNLFSMVGPNYQGGVLNNEIRASIQSIHRLGAVITAMYISVLSVMMLLKIETKPLKITAGLALILVVLQFSLGVLNVIYLLPIDVAIAHNGVAAMLFATVVVSLHFVKKRRTIDAC